MRELLENYIARPVYKGIKKVFGGYMVKRAVQRNLTSGIPCKIVIGASGVSQQGWIPTEESESLNILKPGDWKKYFHDGQVDAMLAEHVWEHLTREQGSRAAAMCFQYLKLGGYIRVAVPDGLHPDPGYIEQVKVGGLDNQRFAASTGSEDAGHKILYTYKTLAEVFQSAGFRVDLLEYFDEQGKFHSKEWHPADGMVHRSKRFDGRNRARTLNYTSIILDAWKDAV
ncbi:MAG: hypothetical protein Q7S63_01340 [bacterium]|nr:hypothetical protein [bacterium]